MPLREVSLTAFLIGIAIILVSCDQREESSSAKFSAAQLPALLPMASPESSLRALADAAANPMDPDLCPTADKPDPGEQPFGGFSSRSVLQFASEPKTQDLYASLVITTKVCTGDTLSSADRSAFSDVLEFFGFKDAKSFVANLSITGNGQGGVKYPQMVPFSYGYDPSMKSYTVQTIGQAIIPWQVTNSFNLFYSYGANQDVTIDTANLFKDIANTVAGGGSSTAILSPAANAYLSAADKVLQDIATSFFKSKNSATDQFTLDMLQQRDRSVTYRFRNLKNKPLAGVRMNVIFTNSIANPIPIDPLSTTPTVPTFTGLPDILTAPLGGALTGTLGDAIAKESSFQAILKATNTTAANDFAALCDTLEAALTAKYGLNRYDSALTMGEVLAYRTPYLNSKNLYSSGCFRNRALLKTMGIDLFEKPPTA